MTNLFLVIVRFVIQSLILISQDQNDALQQQQELMQDNDLNISGHFVRTQIITIKLNIYDFKLIVFSLL